MTGIEAVLVVIPAHDEETLIAACLESVGRARRALTTVPVHVVVVLDACTDGTAAVAADFDVECVSIEATSVGAARAIGLVVGLGRFAGVRPDRIWTAHTDADSAVPDNWLSHQIELADSGADVVVGTVRPDFADLSPAQRAAWLRTHTPGVANGHVHGANLGMRADTLRRAGGFEPVDEHEDVGLVARAGALGAHVVASDEAWVLTSGRGVGRTPGGYARYLREDLVS